MATLPQSDTDEFDAAWVANSNDPYFAEVDADYAKAMPEFAKAFKAKGPPDEPAEKAFHPWLVLKAEHKRPA